MSELEEARREIERLKHENAELRGQLSLPEKHFPGTPYRINNPAPAPYVSEPSSDFTNATPKPLAKVDGRSPIQDKINLFRAIFKGREDVYPALWMNQETGKKGYSPACENPWVGKGKPKKYIPLTDQVIHDHLAGKKTIGVYPLLKDNTCWFLACDFDKSGWELDASAYLQACGKYGIPAYLERSRSGNGGHAWIFFSTPVPAVSARQLGMRLLRDTMEIRAEVDLASYDRFFPNQDFMPRGGFGNLIALPLQKQCRKAGNTEFLDPSDSNLKPHPDQWAFLNGITKLGAAQLDLLLTHIPPIEVGIQAVRKPPASVLKKYPPPDSIRCVLDASISIEKSGIPPWLLSQIKHLASLHNPLFYQRQNMRFSTYGIPRFIRCYGEDAAHIHLPRGVLESFQELVMNAGSRLVLSDSRPEAPKLNLKFHGTLTAQQEKIMAEVLSYEMGVLSAPPGAGKTVMGCFAVSQRNTSTLILSHRKPILEQWRHQLKKHLNLANKEIGQAGGGRKRLSGIVDLAMIQSLKHHEDLREFFSKYGFILVDECHHLPAVSFEEFIKQAPVRHILGLTATPYRRDGLQDIIFMQCGPLRCQMSQSKGDLKLTLKIRTTFFVIHQPELGLTIQDVFQALVQDKDRNGLIVADVAQALADGKRCLVLSQRKEHCQLLVDMLASRGKKARLLTGDLSKKERVTIINEIQNMPKDDEFLLIATGQYIGEGFDCPQMDTLFLAFPVSFKGKLVQYVGRIQREYEEKTEAVVFDYFDDSVPVLKKMSFRRMKTYRQLVSETVPGSKTTA